MKFTQFLMQLYLLNVVRRTQLILLSRTKALLLSKNSQSILKQVVILLLVMGGEILNNSDVKNSSIENGFSGGWRYL